MGNQLISTTPGPWGRPILNSDVYPGTRTSASRTAWPSTISLRKTTAGRTATRRPANNSSASRWAATNDDLRRRPASVKLARKGREEEGPFSEAGRGEALKRNLYFRLAFNNQSIYYHYFSKQSMQLWRLVTTKLDCASGRIDCSIYSSFFFLQPEMEKQGPGHIRKLGF